MQRTNEQTNFRRRNSDYTCFDEREKNTERSAHESGRLRDRTFHPDCLRCGARARMCRTAHTEEIAVGNFGVWANGIPFADARVKGVFKEQGANVAGIIASAVGGTSLRNMLAGGVPYGQVNPRLVVAAIQPGTTLRTDLRPSPHGGGIRVGGALGFSNQIDRRHNVDVVLAGTFLLTVFAAVVSGTLLAIDRRLHRRS